MYVVLYILFASCEDPYKESTFKIYDVQPISSYLEARNGDFSEWLKIMKYADLYNALNQSTQVFTAFAPTNEAVYRFYDNKKINSIEELGVDYARQLVKYHIVKDSVSLDEFIVGGILPKKTLTDDFLEVVFNDSDEEQGGGYNSIYMNGNVHVKELAISTSNGTIYVLDDVMRPMIENIYEQMRENDLNSIFIQAIEMTGWKDSLEIISYQTELPNGQIKENRKYFTVLGVTDNTFKAKGINSVDELISMLGADNNYTNSDNELFRYIGYHILKGNYRLSSLSQFESGKNMKIWETACADAIIKISLEKDGSLCINEDGGQYYKASFIKENSDFAVKNGYIHQVDNILPLYEALLPTAVYFDLCDYPEVESYIGSYGVAGQIYKTAVDTEKTTELWGTNLTCYNAVMGPTGSASTAGAKIGYLTIKNDENNVYYPCMNKDVMELRLGYLGNITLQTPPIIAGKYKVSLVYLYANSLDPLSRGEGSNGGQTKFTFTDMPNISPANVVLYSERTLNGRMNIYDVVLYEEIEFTKTSKQTLNIMLNDPAASSFDKYQVRIDYILFEPIN